MRRLKICQSCESYTMKEEHCTLPTRNPHPPKYAPEDKYASYRRMAKLEERKKEGLL